VIDGNIKDFCPTISIIEDRINSLKKDNEAGNVIKTELEKLRDELIKKNETIKNLTSNINTNNKTITELNKKIDEKSKNDVNSAYNSTKNKLEGTEKDVETAKHRITKYSDEIEVTKCIERIYADDGIKKLVLGIFVPNLNKAIAHNLSMFELPFLIEFDDSMEYRFLSKFGLSTTYNGLSQGQKRKLNFAISMAFRDFVTAIADFKINILFLDEVLDISTDYEALNHMLVLLKNKVIEIGSIYLMTHRGDDFKDNFNHIVEVEHDGRYSSIKIT
jgi:DNA repair exonuclease SbcCD ATPase subunit